MRITEKMAKETARRMLEPLSKRIDEYAEALRTVCLGSQIKGEPRHILETEFPEYFKDGRLVEAVNVGLRFSEPLPISLNDKQRILWRLKVNQIDIDIERTATARYIESTLLSLKTIKKVTKVFPQALPFIPLGKEASQVAYPIESILNTLKKYEA